MDNNSIRERALKRSQLIDLDEDWERRMDNSRTIGKKSKLVVLIRTPELFVLLAAIIAVSLPNSAQAQDWRFEPILSIGVETDDNANLNIRTDQEINSTAFLFDAMADINYTSPTTAFFLQPKVTIRNDDNDVTLDSDNYFLRSRFRRDGILNTFGFLANFDIQAVRTAEREDVDLGVEDPEDVPNDSTGLVFLEGDRNKWRLRPFWEYKLSNLSSIGAELDYREAKYDSVFADILSDYSNARLTLDYTRALSDVTNGLILLWGRRYDADNAPSEVDTYGLGVEIEHRLSIKTQIKVGVGVEDADRPDVESDPQLVYTASINRRLETIRMFAEYRRSPVGTGAGRISMRDSLNVNFRRRLNEKISAGIGVRAYSEDRSGVSDSAADRNYVQLRSTLLWYLTETFVIQADYRYTAIDRGADLGGRANSNRVNLWFRYQPYSVPRL
jgi:hypothetical protein